MALLLWRSNPRRQRDASLAALFAKTEIPNGLYWGIIGTASSGQGSQTSDLSATATTASDAVITSGAGAQTVDIVGVLISAGDLDAGQGSQTVDGIILPTLNADLDSGQGDQTSDAAGSLSAFQAIAPKGFWDSANVERRDGRSLWQMNPRFQGGGISRVHALGGVRPMVVGGGPGFEPIYGDGSAHFELANALQWNPIPWSTESDGFGAALIRYVDAQVVGLSGISDGALGTAIIFNATISSDIEAGQGSQRADIVAASDSFDQYVGADGFRGDGVGTHSIENKSRTVYPQRIDPLGFGDLEVIGPRYITPSGLLSEAIGTPTVFGPQYVALSGIDSAVMGSLNDISNYTRTVQVSAIDPPVSQVGLNGAVTAPVGQYVYPEGLDAPEIFEPIIGNEGYQVIELVTLGDLAEFGDVTFEETASPPSGTTRYIKVKPIAPGSFGSTRINPVQLRVTGMAPGSFGTAWVSNYTRYVRPGGITGIRFGTNWISNYIRYVELEGFDHSLVWDDFGPIDLDGNRGRIYNVYGEATGVIGNVGIGVGVVGEPSLRFNLC